MLYRQIKNAVTITIAIATEAECIEEEWLNDEDQMNSNELLQDLSSGASMARWMLTIIPNDWPFVFQRPVRSEIEIWRW